MVTESEIKMQHGGYRDGAGRLKMYQDHPDAYQKRITIPAVFWDALKSEYEGERGRNWASYGVYEILKEWYEKRENQSSLDLTP